MVTEGISFFERGKEFSLKVVLSKSSGCLKTSSTINKKILLPVEVGTWQHVFKHMTLWKYLSHLLFPNLS